MTSKGARSSFGKSGLILLYANKETHTVSSTAINNLLPEDLYMVLISFFCTVKISVT